MDDEDRSANRQQVRREVVIQDVGPPPVGVASPKLRTHGIGRDLGELGVSLGGDLRRNGELEGLAEGPARRRGEDDDGYRPDTWRQYRYCGPTLRTAEQYETPIPPWGPLHPGQYALVVGHALADGVMCMERRGAAAERVLRCVVRAHAVLLDHHHGEFRKQALGAKQVRVLGRGQEARTLGEDQNTLVRPATPRIDRPMDQAAVVSLGREIQGGGRGRPTREERQRANGYRQRR